MGEETAVAALTKPEAVNQEASDAAASSTAEIQSAQNGDEKKMKVTVGKEQAVKVNAKHSHSKSSEASKIQAVAAAKVKELEEKIKKAKDVAKKVSAEGGADGHAAMASELKGKSEAARQKAEDMKAKAETLNAKEVDLKAKSK